LDEKGAEALNGQGSSEQYQADPGSCLFEIPGIPALASIYLAHSIIVTDSDFNRYGHAEHGHTVLDHTAWLQAELS
jgi:hypothetical protein